MKIGILTFHCVLNYGAVLQAYGLQEYLKKLGHTVYVIDYCPTYLLLPYKIFHWSWIPNLSVIRNLLLFLRAIFVIPVRLRRHKLFEHFVFTRLNIYSADLSDTNLDLDAFVLGSDQIWNPQITAGFDGIYFGQFPAAKGRKVIAYAASAGSTIYLDSVRDQFFALLSHVGAISVREKVLADYISEQSWDKAVDVTLDPVLLAGKEIYLPLISKSENRRPYVLSVQLVYNEMQSSFAKEIARQKGLELIELAPSSESLKNRSLLMSEGPEVFLTLLWNADYVVTSSFHGLAFAILFEKEFNAVSLDIKHSERMHGLLAALGLDDRLIVSGQHLTASDRIDYSSINQILENLRSSSRTFIEKALGN